MNIAKALYSFSMVGCMQILMGLEYTIVSLDQSRMNTYHLLSFIKTQFSSFKIERDTVFLTYLKENHYKHLFLLKWVHSMYKKMHKNDIPNLRDVLIERLEKPLHIMIKNDIQAVNVIHLNVYKNNRVCFSFESKNYRLFWGLHYTFKKSIYAVSYQNNFFDISVTDETSLDELHDIIEKSNIFEMEVIFKYRIEELRRLLFHKEADEFIGALKTLHSSPNDSIHIIKKRYKKLLVHYHPDNVYQEGIEKINEYTEIFKNLQISFEIVQNQRQNF